jgi:MarR family transcriptional regulator, organic hydroperoxide resistance regulator
MHPIEETVGFHIALPCRAHRNLIAQQLATFGLYVGQELILVQLWKEEGLTQTVLAERVGIDVSTMTKALQRLERYGLVTRQLDSNDTRIWRVFLTDQGRTLQPQITAAWDQVEQHALAGFTPDESAMLSQLLQRIERNLT